MRLFINVLRVLGVLSLIAFVALLLFKNSKYSALRFSTEKIWLMGYISLGLFVLLVLLDIIAHISKKN